MTTVRIPAPDIEADVNAPDIEADVSAADVVMYLLARGWVERPRPEVPWRSFAGQGTTVEVPTYTREGAGTWFAMAIADIARAEQRHPSAVLADIVGPVRAASGGATCVTGESLDDRVSRTRCAMRAATERHARRLRLERESECRRDPFCSRTCERGTNGCDVRHGADADSTAHGAGEESEGA